MSTLTPLFVSHWPWIIVGTILVGLEIVVPGVFLLWIGLGAIVVGLSVLLAPDLPLAWQLLLFAFAMVSSTGIGFAIQRKSRISTSGVTLNCELDAMIGRHAQAIEDFIGGQGRIRLGDTSYTAECQAPIVAGTLLMITGHTPDGRFVVAPLEEG